MHEVQRRSLLTQGLFHITPKIVIRNKPKVTASSFYPAQSQNLFSQGPKSAAVGHRPRKIQNSRTIHHARENSSPRDYNTGVTAPKLGTNSPKLMLPTEFRTIASNSIPTLQVVRTRSRHRGILKPP